MFRNFRGFLLALTLWAFYRIYPLLWRVEHVGIPARAPGSGPRIYAHWHGDELLLIGAYRGREPMAVMASRSRDGEFLKTVLTWLGFRVVRGSSSRGGAAGLKGLIDVVQKEGINASLAVDGPRGPIYQVKPGVLKLAQETGALLLPGAAAASGRIVFKKAWNQCYLPTPFAKCVIVYGEPIQVPPDLSEAEFESLRVKLQNTLRSLKVDAEARFSRSPSQLPLPVHAGV